MISICYNINFLFNCIFINPSVFGLNFNDSQGELEVVKEVHGRAIADKKENGDVLNNGSAGDSVVEAKNLVQETSRMPFLMLGLDLPPPPLFKDVMEKNIIPQVYLCLKCLLFDHHLPSVEIKSPRLGNLSPELII